MSHASSKCIYDIKLQKSRMDYNQTTSLSFVPIKNELPARQKDTQEEKIQMCSLTFPELFIQESC